VLLNMASVYRIVAIRVNETSWAHVWRLHFRYLGTGYDRNLSGCPLIRNLADWSFSLVAIDYCQWPLLVRYLIEAYLAHHPLDSPCASHALLAIQEHHVVVLTLLVSVAPNCYHVS
jgi:hypothetical protein